MRPLDLGKEIRSKKIRPVYLIFGEEEYWHEKLIHGLSSLFESGIESFSGDEIDWSGLSELLTQPSFFGPRLYVVRRAEEMLAGLTKEESEPLRKLSSVAPGNSCVLSSTSKTNPFAKAFVSSLKDLDVVTVEATHPSFYEACQWVRDELTASRHKVSKDAVEALVSIVGRDMQRLQKEVEKLMLFSFASEAAEITKSVVLSCVSPNQDTNTFALIDAVSRKNTIQASQEAEELMARGVNQILIISALGSHLALMWRVKEETQKGTPQTEIAKALGVHPYSVKKALEQSKLWNFQDLERALRLLCDVDESIKKGIFDPQSAIKYLILQLTQGRS